MRFNIILSFFCFVSCQPSNSTKGEVAVESSSLIGEWRNLTLRVELDKKHGAPTSIFEANEKTWEEKLQIRPIRTYFNEDGSFNSAHYNLSDSLVMNPEGTWAVTGEEITMITTKPFKDTTTCTYSIKDGVVTFGCWVDWDEDGEKDDWYLGTQRKF